MPYVCHQTIATTRTIVQIGGLLINDTAMQRLLFALVLCASFTGCIKDDFVDDLQDPMLQITTLVDTIAISTDFQFEARYLNNIGREETVTITWASSNDTIISITAHGLGTANQLGSAWVWATHEDEMLTDSVWVSVGVNTVTTPLLRTGIVNTTSTYALSGNFSLEADGDDLILQFADNYAASDALPGLFVYLSNNANSNVDALEIGPVTVFSGAHSYTIPNTGILDYQNVLYYCKPFNVKVGHGEIE